MGPADAGDDTSIIKIHKYDGHAENFRNFESHFRNMLRTKLFEVSIVIFPLPTGGTRRTLIGELHSINEDGTPDPGNAKAIPQSTPRVPNTPTEARRMLDELKHNTGSNHDRFEAPADNIRLHAYLHQCVSQNVQSQLCSAHNGAIYDSEDGWAAWQFLKLSAQGQMVARAKQLRVTIRAMRWNGKKSLQFFVNELDLLMDQLDRCGDRTTEQGKIDFLSQAMPDSHAAWASFDSAHTLSAIKDELEPSYSKFASDLIQYVDVMTAKSAAPTGSAALQNTHRQALAMRREDDKKPAGAGFHKGTTRGKGKGKGQTRNDKTHHTCYHCGEKGHHAGDDECKAQAGQAAPKLDELSRKELIAMITQSDKHAENNSPIHGGPADPAETGAASTGNDGRTSVDTGYLRQLVAAAAINGPSEAEAGTRFAFVNLRGTTAHRGRGHVRTEPEVPLRGVPSPEPGIAEATEILNLCSSESEDGSCTGNCTNQFTETSATGGEPECRTGVGWSRCVS